MRSSLGTVIVRRIWVLVLRSLSSSDDPVAFLNQLTPESIPWIPP